MNAEQATGELLISLRLSRCDGIIKVHMYMYTYAALKVFD